MRIAAAVLLTLLFCGSAGAVVWDPSEKTDPLTGEKVPAAEVVSFGDYVYDSPSKYDLVFWPLTDWHFICLNPKNGYAAFNSDFEKLSDEEKVALTDWLAKNYNPAQPPKSHKDKLAWLEKVYGQRRMDDEFWCRFYRLMAYVHREDEKTSLAYVQKAMPFLQKKLGLNPKGIDRLNVLYLLGEYHRRLGEARTAEEYFSQLKDVTYTDDKGREQIGHPYFIKLVQDLQNRKNKGASKKTNANADDGR